MEISLGRLSGGGSPWIRRQLEVLRSTIPPISFHSLFIAPHSCSHGRSLSLSRATTCQSSPTSSGCKENGEIPMKGSKVWLKGMKYPELESFKEKRFLYDIVANGRNGIDVEKFDYIVREFRACGLGCNFQFQRVLETMRVIDDEICYRAKDYLTIRKLFAVRADLHRTVYTHAKVKAIELMFVDALTKANDILRISTYIEEPALYWKLDDSILKTIETSSCQDLKESRDLVLCIRRRDLYQFCKEFAVLKEKLEYFKNITPKDIVCSQV